MDFQLATIERLDPVYPPKWLSLLIRSGVEPPWVET